jgi:hypothetical protein
MSVKSPIDAGSELLFAEHNRLFPMLKTGGILDFDLTLAPDFYVSREEARTLRPASGS